MSYDGNKITYDTCGNPINYINGLRLKWEDNRLSEISRCGTTVKYLYDCDGNRTEKIVDGTKIDLDLVNERQAEQDNILQWFLTEDGNCFGFSYNGESYKYIYNLQGDVIGISDANDDVIATYRYDTWGKLISILDGNGNDVTNDKDHIGYINPLRYRGYYYDSETGFYYLHSRYYDPETGRFLSKDDKQYLENNGKDVTNFNFYSYCLNNPVNMVDYDGRDPTTLALLAMNPELAVAAALVTAAMAPILLTNPKIKAIVDSAISWAVSACIESAATILAKFKELGQNLANKIADLVKSYNIYLAKQKIPSKMKDGDKVKTPNTHPDEFSKNKDGSYTHNKTGWKVKKGPPHGGEHWDVSPADGRGHADVAPDGKVIRGFRY